jgi:hypothetical protein
MKNNYILLVLCIILTTTFSIQAQTVNIKPNYFDAWVSYDGATGIAAVNDYGDNLLINNGTGITSTTSKLNCAVMNFLLPAIPTGTTLVSATFTATSVRKDVGVNSNGDLYGINFREADKALTTDYYSGAFVLGTNAGNGTDWGIMDNMFAVTDASGASQITTKVTDAAASAQLLSFIKKQYQDGGVNHYAFLRLSLDNLASALWQRFAIASEANATYAPKLTLTFGNGTAVDIVQGVNFVLYANSAKQIIVEGENLTGGEMQVFNLEGKRVAIETINNNKFVSTLHFVTGSYLVNIKNNEGLIKAQKLIVK